NLRRHIGELELNRLKLSYWLTELFAFFRVTQRGFVGALRHANCQSRYGNAAAIQYLHGINKAHAFFSQAAFVRHVTVFKYDAGGFRGAQPEFVLLLCRRKPFCALLKNERSYSSVSFGAVGRSHRDASVGVNSMGN